LFRFFDASRPVTRIVFGMKLSCDRVGDVNNNLD
jgi:hypothetical protein